MRLRVIAVCDQLYRNVYGTEDGAKETCSPPTSAGDVLNSPRRVAERGGPLNHLQDWGKPRYCH